MSTRFGGELAWQLGGAEAYELVADADRSRTAPGGEAVGGVRSRASRARCAISVGVPSISTLTPPSSAVSGSKVSIWDVSSEAGHEVVRPGTYPGRERVRASVEVQKPDSGIPDDETPQLRFVTRTRGHEPPCLGRAGSRAWRTCFPPLCRLSAMFLTVVGWPQPCRFRDLSAMVKGCRC
jgi:hypothetical protein